MLPQMIDLLTWNPKHVNSLSMEKKIWLQRRKHTLLQATGYVHAKVLDMKDQTCEIEPKKRVRLNKVYSKIKISTAIGA